MSKLKTYVALIIDESGSMGTIYEQAMSNFNEQLQVLKEESNSPEAVAKKLLIGGEEYEGIETQVSVVKFNQRVNTIIELTNVDDVEEITEEDYSPHGTTALYDAIGGTISRFQEIDGLDDPGASVLFVIITDGYENSSTDFKHEKVKSLVDELSATDKWTFTFMGTEDALEQAVDIGINPGNIASFTATADGMKVATNNMTDGLRGYYNARSTGMTSMASFYDDDKLQQQSGDNNKDNS